MGRAMTSRFRGVRASGGSRAGRSPAWFTLAISPCCRNTARLAGETADAATAHARRESAWICVSLWLISQCQRWPKDIDAGPQDTAVVIDGDRRRTREV